MKIAILSEQKCKILAPWYNTVKACEREFSSASVSPSSLVYFNSSIRDLNTYIWRINSIIRKYVSRRSHCPICGVEDYSLLKQVAAMRPDYCVYIAMGCDDLYINLATLRRLPVPLIVYCYDTWESLYDRWLYALNEIHPLHIFMAYKKSVGYFSNVFEGNVHFLPQSYDNRYFMDYGLDKTRLFIQMGRQVPSLHELANNYLIKNHIDNIDANYLYPRSKSLISQTMEQLARNINSTYFFFAAPQNMHNGQFTGGISEVTARFYEAMACKSMIVGYKPLDSFEDLFPHETAMIQLNACSDDFDDKIDWWLNHPNEYNDVVNYNYEYVRKHHCLEQRYYRMLQLLS